MTNEEIVAKIRAGENVSENLESLYLQNEGLIAKIASCYIGKEELEDLKQEGYFGLMTALELWSPEGGASFSTYAFQWIRSAIKRYIDDNGSIVRLSSHQLERIRKYKRAVESFCQSFGKNPTSRELAFYLRISPDEVDKIKRDAQFLNVRSTSETIGEDESLTLGDTIEDERNGIEVTLEEIQNEELARLLWSLVDDLEENESEVLRERYKEGLTLQTCGDKLGLPKEEVHKIEIKALRKMRKPSIRRQLEPYIEERALSVARQSSGLGAFRRTMTSAPERAVLFIEEYERRAL